VQYTRTHKAADTNTHEDALLHKRATTHTSHTNTHHTHTQTDIDTHTHTNTNTHTLCAGTVVQDAAHEKEEGGEWNPQS